MSSATETQSSFDDVKELVAPITYPVTAKAQLGQVVARAFRIDGGGDVVIKTASGNSRTLTALEDPYFAEVKITQITSATAATKIRLFA